MSRVNDLMIEVDRRRAESGHTTATALDAQRGFSEGSARESLVISSQASFATAGAPTSSTAK